jgi:transposase
MAKTKKGEAIGEWGRTPAARRRLWNLREEAKRAGDVKTWQRASAVLGYIRGKSVISMADFYGTTRGSINRWLQWYEADGAEGLRTMKQPGRAPKLDAAQRQELATLVEAGPQAAGYMTGVWTGPMVGDLIHKRYGVRYHVQHVPWLLHQLGFSVQRPRKQLARADAEKQDTWLRERFPAIKKKRRDAVARSSSRTRPASGSTAPSTEPGHP